MSYSDDYKDMQIVALLRKWTPDGIGNLKVTESNLRYHLARARAAEAELAEIKDALAAFKKVLA